MDPDRDVALSPVAVPPMPLRVGVGSPMVDPWAGLVRVTVGAARSTVRLSVFDGSLPMPERGLRDVGGNRDGHDAVGESA